MPRRETTAGVETPEDDLLPDDAGEEWEGSEGAAVERLETAPKPVRPAPFDLGDPFFRIHATITNISLGKPVSNVSASFAVALAYPYDGFTDLMGEHALAAMFGGSFLGNGIIVRDVALHADVENDVVQKIKLVMPRYDDGKDQLAAYVAPFLDDPAIMDRLLNYAGAWRLNLPVKIEGELALYEPQERFDLTRKADEEE